MATGWFRIPETGQGTDADPVRPDYLDTIGIEDWTGNTMAQSPRFLVRVYGTSQQLDELRAKNEVTEHTPEKARSTFHGSGASHLAFDVPTTEDLHRRFKVA